MDCASALMALLTSAKTRAINSSVCLLGAAACGPYDEVKATAKFCIGLTGSPIAIVYLVGQGGFAKITHDESEKTPVTLSTDVIEFGGGIGWSYRVSAKVSAGVEGYYLVGSILSRATTGSTNMLLASALVTVFL